CRPPIALLFPYTTLFRSRQLAAARETHTKRLALHEGHRIEGKPVRLARAQQWHDVRMLQSRRDLDLASEPFRAHACGQLGRQDRSEEHTSELQSLAYLVC